MLAAETARAIWALYNLEGIIPPAELAQYLAGRGNKNRPEAC